MAYFSPYLHDARKAICAYVHCEVKTLTMVGFAFPHMSRKAHV